MEAFFFNKLEIILSSRSRPMARVEGVHASSSSRLTNVDSCIEWTGSVNKSGYADIYLRLPNQKKKFHTYAHRGVYMLEHRLIEIPRIDNNGSKLEVSHLCNNKICLKLQHLNLETSALNRERKMCHRSGMCIGHNPTCIFNVMVGILDQINDVIRKLRL